MTIQQKKLQYIYETNDNYKLIVNNDGTATIEFYGGATISLTIRSADTVGFSKKIEIKVIEFGDL